MNKRSGIGSTEFQEKIAGQKVDVGFLKSLAGEIGRQVLTFDGLVYSRALSTRLGIKRITGRRKENDIFPVGNKGPSGECDLHKRSGVFKGTSVGMEGISLDRRWKYWYTDEAVENSCLDHSIPGPFGIFFQGDDTLEITHRREGRQSPARLGSETKTQKLYPSRSPI